MLDRAVRLLTIGLLVLAVARLPPHRRAAGFLGGFFLSLLLLTRVDPASGRVLPSPTLCSFVLLAIAAMLLSRTPIRKLRP